MITAKKGERTIYYDDDKGWMYLDNNEIFNPVTYKDLRKFRGNKLTSDEKIYRMNSLHNLIKNNSVDDEIIPYLERINSYSFICTTQSCKGHDGYRGYIDFRSGLSCENTINKIIKPLQDKYYDNLIVELNTDCNMLRYILWLDNKQWKDQLDTLCGLLENIEL